MKRGTFFFEFCWKEASPCVKLILSQTSERGESKLPQFFFFFLFFWGDAGGRAFQAVLRWPRGPLVILTTSQFSVRIQVRSAPLAILVVQGPPGPHPAMLGHNVNKTHPLEYLYSLANLPLVFKKFNQVQFSSKTLLFQTSNPIISSEYFASDFQIIYAADIIRPQLNSQSRIWDRNGIWQTF